MDADDARQHLRAVLHDEGARQGHRARAVHRLRHRQAERRAHRGGQRARPAARTFKIYLPRVGGGPADAPQPSAQRRRVTGGPETHPAGRGRGGRARAGARRSSQRSGYTVLEAERRRRGARIAREATQPDRPARDRRGDAGHERARARRAASTRCTRTCRSCTCRATPTTPIVHHGVLEAGTAFLQKPFTPADLARRVREMLDAEADRRRAGSRA